MSTHCIDKIWKLLLQTAFGPCRCTTGTDLAAEQTIVPYAAALQALATLGGEMDEIQGEYGSILTCKTAANAKGGIREIQLRFGRSKNLCGICVTWEADGCTFRALKDCLDRELGASGCRRRGFDLACSYSQPFGQIELIGNPLGFGMPRIVTLSCLLGYEEGVVGPFFRLDDTKCRTNIAA